MTTPPQTREQLDHIEYVEVRKGLMRLAWMFTTSLLIVVALFVYAASQDLDQITAVASFLAAIAGVFGDRLASTVASYSKLTKAEPNPLEPK